MPPAIVALITFAATWVFLTFSPTVHTDEHNEKFYHPTEIKIGQIYNPQPNKLTLIDISDLQSPKQVQFK